MIIEGAVAVVTGGASGIGLAFCRELLRKGASEVVVLDVLEREGSEAQKYLQDEFGQSAVKFVRCDVTEKEDLKDAMSQVAGEHGRLDILCNNAGICVSDEENCWEKIVSVNLVGPIRGTKLALDLMSSGVIINTSSVFGIQSHLVPVYTSTKGGIISFTRAAAMDPVAVDKGIRVNCICPPAVDTQLFRKLMSDCDEIPLLSNPRKRMKDDIDKIKAGKLPFLKPDVIAKGLIQLIEDDSKNGETLVILDENTSGYHHFNELGVFQQNTK